MSRELAPIWEGAHPVYRFRIRDGLGWRDMASAAVEVYIEDADTGASLGMRPGVIISPKVDGYVDIVLRGKETDFGGLGGRIALIPRIYYATGLDGTPAANLLLNPSFDTDSVAPTGIADNWSLIGAQTAVWAVYANDSAPPSIFGNFQLVGHPSTSDPDYIQQSFSGQSIAVGDQYSSGVWHRTDGIGGTLGDTHAIFFRTGANANSIVRFKVGSNDWYFSTGTLVSPTAETTCAMGLDGRGTTLSNRYDDAFFFKGTWAKFFGERLIVPVKRHPRAPKTSNQIAGIGGFEQDSNVDGVADGWSKQGAGGTFTIEKTALNVAEGTASQKVVLTDQSSIYLIARPRRKYVVGEQWNASVKLKTNGALTVGVGTGGFKITLGTEAFEAAPQQSAAAIFGTNQPTFTTYTATLTIATVDRSQLAVTLWLNGVTGTIWLDDVRLWKT